MSKKGMKYDYKKAYDKNLKPSARLHYLENARHDQDSGSPNKFMGGIAGAAGQIGTGNSSIMGGFLENNTAYQMAMQRKQAQQAAGALGNSTLAAAGQAVAPTADMSAGSAMDGGAMDQVNPFQGKTFKIEPASPTAMVDPELTSAGIQPETTYEPPMQGNQMGNAKPLFNAAVHASAEAIYGSPMQRQMSMPGAPMFFKDQTGDGKITQADVIKARTEGYKK